MHFCGNRTTALISAVVAASGLSLAGSISTGSAAAREWSTPMPVFGDKRHQRALGCTLRKNGSVLVTGGFGSSRFFPADLIGTANVRSDGRAMGGRKPWRRQLRVTHSGIAARLADGSLLLSTVDDDLRTTTLRRVLPDGTRDSRFGDRGLLTVDGYVDVHSIDTGGFAIRSGTAADLATVRVFNSRGGALGRPADVRGTVESITRDPDSGKVYVVISEADLMRSIVRLNADGSTDFGFNRHGIRGTTGFDRSSTVPVVAARLGEVTALVVTYDKPGDFTSDRTGKLVSIGSDGRIVAESGPVSSDPFPGDSGDPVTFERKLWITADRRAVFFDWRRDGNSRGGYEAFRWDRKSQQIDTLLDRRPSSSGSSARGTFFDDPRAVLSNDGRRLVLCGTATRIRAGTTRKLHVTVRQIDLGRERD